MPTLPYPTRANRSYRSSGRRLAGEEAGPGERPYLSGLARRQVKKHSRPKTSTRQRTLKTAVRTMSRVGDRRAILR